jgi:mono/diheme cytochrome c family protein
MRVSLPLTLFLLSSTACQQPASPPVMPPVAPIEAKAEPAAPAPDPGVIASLDLVALKGAGELDALEVVEATVALDPAYHAAMRYRGWRLKDVLALMPELAGLDASKHELRMVALDGYTVTAPLAGLLEGQGVIAFEDAARPGGQPWATFMQGKREITPAPLYLVWDNTPYGPKFPWPYQLARVAILSTEAAYGRAYPTHALEDAEVMAGFALYKQRCMSCHSINLSGGVVGPELNVPRNVTEYWTEANIRALVHNPRSFRARSVMPGFPDLTDADLDVILRYLRAMAGAKLCDTAESCEAHAE